MNLAGVPWAGWGAAAAALVGLGCLAVLGWRRRQRRLRRLETLVESVANDYLRDVLVPDGAEGWIHLDYLLKTASGVVVLDVRDVRGALFGGEHLTDWTVMDGHERRTFPNPLEGLYDRMAAVRALVGDEVPVDGRVVLLARARFATSAPPRTLLMEEIRQLAPPSGEACAEAYAEAWRHLCSSTQPTPRPLRRRA